MPKVSGPTKTVQFMDFSGGLNRTAARQRMKDTQLYWNENAQPIGPGQLQTLAPKGTSIATVAAGVAAMYGANLKLGGVQVARLITINNDGSITAVNPLNGAQTSVAPAGIVTSKARVIPWQDTPLLIGDPTNGYFSWDGTTRFKYPFTFTGDTTNGSAVVINIASTTGYQGGSVMGLSGTGIPAGAQIKSVDSATQITMTLNATATAAGVTITVGAGAPTAVTDLSVFEGHVWAISASRTLTFTGPAAWADFSAANGGGTTAISDSVFAGSITRLLSALELLWLVGPSAINAISNVSTSGGITTLSDTNIVANVGSVLPSSVASFFRTFLFLSPYGVYAIVGATPQKLSDDLDGLLPLLSLSADQPAGVFALNNVFVWTVLVTYKDPVAGNRPILLCFARNAWFPASQGTTLTWIASIVDPTTGQPQLWGTDGSTVFQCFAGTGAATHTIQTKLWDFGAFTQRKQLVKAAVEFNSANPVVTTIAAENESGNQATTLTISPQNTLTWTGAGGAALTFTGLGGAAITWITSGVQVAWGQVDFAGNYLGLKLSGTSLPFVLSGIAMEIDPMGEWTFRK